MKRDCGKGELIPYKWEVICCPTKADRELEYKFPTQAEAESKFNALKPKLTSCGNVRLYVLDKQGYANCIQSYSILANGNIHETDRRNELCK